MIIGCFALIEPFTPLARQFELIRSLGIQHADLTDNHDGAGLGAEYGFHAAVSLDQRPGTIRELAKKNGLSLASVCAHANLLDATDPAVYGTSQIIKAIRLAHLLGIKQVITTEGDPKTDFGHRLTEAEQNVANSRCAGRTRCGRDQPRYRQFMARWRRSSAIRQNIRTPHQARALERHV